MQDNHILARDKVVKADTTISNDKEFIKFIKLHSASPSTIKYYCSLIDRFNRYYSEVSYENVFKFIKGAEGKSPNYKEANLAGGKEYSNTAPRKSAIKLYLEYLKKPELVNMLDSIKSSTLIKKRGYKPRTFETNTAFDIDKFKEFIEEFEPSEQLAIRLMWQTACRISSISRMKCKDLQFDKLNSRYMAMLYKKGVGENGYKRAITKELFDDINKYITDNKLDENSFVFRFISYNGKYAKYESEASFKFGLYTKLKNNSRRFKLTGYEFGISPHYIRHSRADNIYNVGINGERKHEILLVKEQLSHKSIVATERYLNFDERKAEDDTAEIINSQKNNV